MVLASNASNSILSGGMTCFFKLSRACNDLVRKFVAALVGPHYDGAYCLAPRPGGPVNHSGNWNYSGRRLFMSWHLVRRQSRAITPSGRSLRGGGRRALQSRLVRRLQLESLEQRTVMTALPFGAMPDDTGEYMLGDVHVTVVLLESNNQIDSGTITDYGDPITYTPENWTQSAIAAVKSNVEQGINWWKSTLDSLPNVRDGLLNFTFDWTHANTPAPTRYEPIARRSDSYQLWVYDFLTPALNQLGIASQFNIGADIRAFNNAQRQANNADWAFTLFVVNDEHDPDNMFAAGGAFRTAFSFAGGRFAVIPASRPVSTITHETAHLFWALDEYSGGSTYTARRGYYNTQNLNAEDNPTAGFVQGPSIMALDRPSADPPTFARTEAFAGHFTSASSAAMLGWQDSDDDGIFDVLDVPFTLTGSGRFDPATGRYNFTGTSAVQTLPNLNPAGLQNDITINRIREVQYAIDGDDWQVAQTFPDRTYKTSLNLSIGPLGEGEHTIKIRTIDTRTGVTSPIFIGHTSSPAEQVPSSGASGFVFFDSNGDSGWGPNESPIVDWTVELVDDFGTPIVLERKIEPDDYLEEEPLNSVHVEATLSAIGADVASDVVTARSSVVAGGSGRTFWTTSLSQELGGPIETWTTASRKLRIDFSGSVPSVWLKALGAGPGASVGRLDAYDASGKLVARFTTKALTAGQHEMMVVGRAQADIKYVIAHAHLGGEIALDSLSWGARASTTTNAQGAWSLPNLGGGSYHVKVTPPAHHLVTLPIGGEYSVSYNPGDSIGNLNFGIYNTDNIWHNIAFPVNVNNDRNLLVNAMDILVLINWLSVRGVEAPMPAEGDSTVSGFVDVNNDKQCNMLDILAVINYITVHPVIVGGGDSFASGASDQAGEGGTSYLNSVGRGGSQSGAAEGEIGAETLTAAEYFSQLRVHFLNIPGLEEDDHQHHDEQFEHDVAQTALPLEFSSAAHEPLFDLIAADAARDDAGGWLAWSIQQDDEAPLSSGWALPAEEVHQVPSPSESSDVAPALKPTADDSLLSRRKKLAKTIDLLAHQSPAEAAEAPDFPQVARRGRHR